MGARLDCLIGMKAAKKKIEERLFKSHRMKDVNKTMTRMVDSHKNMAAIMHRKQNLLEKQDKLASLWKLQEYYVTTNKVSKMSVVMSQFEMLTDSLTQTNKEPEDDDIEIDIDDSDEEEMEDNINDANNNDVEE